MQKNYVKNLENLNNRIAILIGMLIMKTINGFTVFDSRKEAAIFLKTKKPFIKNQVEYNVFKNTQMG